MPRPAFHLLGKGLQTSQSRLKTRHGSRAPALQPPQSPIQSIRGWELLVAGKASKKRRAGKQSKSFIRWQGKTRMGQCPGRAVRVSLGSTLALRGGQIYGTARHGTAHAQRWTVQPTTCARLVAGWAQAGPPANMDRRAKARSRAYLRDFLAILKNSCRPDLTASAIWSRFW